MKIYLQSRNRLIDIKNRFLVAKGLGVGGLEGWDSKCKLLYEGWINKWSYYVV